MVEVFLFVCMRTEQSSKLRETKDMPKKNKEQYVMVTIETILGITGETPGAGDENRPRAFIHNNPGHDFVLTGA